MPLSNVDIFLDLIFLFSITSIVSSVFIRHFLKTIVYATCLFFASYAHETFELWESYVIDSLYTLKRCLETKNCFL